MLTLTLPESYQVDLLSDIAWLTGGYIDADTTFCAYAAKVVADQLRLDMIRSVDNTELRCGKSMK